RKFAAFLGESGELERSPLPRDVLPRFAEWLNSGPLGPSAQSSLTKVTQLVGWCERNAPGVVARDADLLVRRIRSLSPKTAQDGLPLSVVKEILRACYADIERIERERAQVRLILAGKLTSSKELEFFELARDLIWVGRGRLAAQPQYNRAGGALARRVEDFGGSRVISRLIYFSPQDLLPFLLAIIAQTFGNPDAIKEAKEGCIGNHPIRSDLERITWKKGRAGSEQVSDFPRGKKWSAPELIRRLCILTADFRPSVPKADRDKLFICYLWHGRRFGFPHKKQLLDELGKFIARHNLPAFQFRDMRRSGAQIVRGVAGNIRDSQSLLNHQSPNTTVRYTRTQSVADHEDQTINKHQVQLVQLAKYGVPPPSQSGSSGPQFDLPVDGMETTFGFRCKDPLAGLAPGSSRGSMCLQFFSCAGCPGALIPLDDVLVGARCRCALAALKEAGSRAEGEGWWTQFEAVDERRSLLIEESFLPAVSQPVLERARSQMSMNLIPRLE
ncbi:hypothetical protein WDZ92_33035, partial [Nostoc sp. NIES-2111]